MGHARQGEDDVPKEIEDLCAGFMRCADCHADPEVRHHLLSRDVLCQPPLRVAPRAWFPPRGWGGSLAPGKRDLLLVSTNPGHPLPAEEAVWEGYPARPDDAGHITRKQAVAQLDFVNALYRGEPGRTSFHTRSVQVARALLWLVDERNGGHADLRPWLDRVWFTDVVKCSTAQESGSPGIGAMTDRCRRHLQDEIGAFSPRLVVALGSAAFNALQAAGLRLPMTLKMPHPAGRGWRRIDRPEMDEVFKVACVLLDLEWTVVRGRFAQFRRALAIHPRGDSR